MEVFEILFLAGFIIVILIGVGFLMVKLTVTPKKIEEKKIGKIEEYLKNNKKTVNDLDSFFAEQWKPYSEAVDRHWIFIFTVCMVIMLIIGIYCSNDESKKEAGVIFFWIAGICFLLLCVYGVLLLFGVGETKFDKAFPRAKENFRKVYPFYTNQRLNREIVKADKSRLEIKAFYYETHIIWFCSDFILYCSMLRYYFIFIRYEDIEYILVKKLNHTAYRDPLSTLDYTFYIYYKTNGKEKKFTFTALSDYPIVREFKKKNVEVSDVSDD